MADLSYVAVLHFLAEDTKIPTSDRWVGLVIVIALTAIFAGFFLPAFAGWRMQGIHPEKISDPEAKRQAETKLAAWTRLHDRSAFAVIMGQDGRLSSSKAVGLAWTVLVAYVLVVLLRVWPSDWEAALTNLSPTYLLFLGGPYASLVLAKAITSTRAEGGGLVKPTSDGSARISDLISDDSGRTDLFDVQFLLFNAIAIWFAIAAFNKATLSGFPTIPEGIVLLTAGPAAVYLSNKLFYNSSASITSTTPSRVSEGDEFLIVGSGFLAGYSAGITPAGVGTVDVDGIQATTDLSRWTDGRVPAIAPHVAHDGSPSKVTVTGPGGIVASLEAALTVEDRPVIVGFDKTVALPGQNLVITVDWPPSTAAGTPVVLTLGAIAVQAPPTVGPGLHPITVVVPNGLPPGQDVPVVAKGAGPPSVAKRIAL